jgi:glycosyltransferase involved in cell wall biosynthesis
MGSLQPKVLMFAPLCYPAAGSEAIATSKLLLAALDAGWEIDVISQANFGQYYPTTSGGIWEPLARIIHNVDGIKEISTIKELSRRNEKQSFMKLQSMSWAGKALFIAFYLHLKKKYDFILSRATPQYGHLPALIFSQWVTIPWVANWSDPVPLQKAPPPYGKGPDTPIPFYLEKYCSAVARSATWHTFPCERLREYFCSYLPDLAEKSSIIPHIALTRFRSQYAGKNVGFSLCCVGSLTFRDPYIFLEGVSRFLKKTRVEAPFCIRFVGLPLENLQDTVRNLGLVEIVTIEKAKTYEETQEIIGNSSVLVVIEAPCVEGIFFPSKFVDFVQTGRPILGISPINGTLADILSRCGGGILADCHSPEAVANAIRILYEEWRAGELDEKYGSSGLFDLFSEKRVLGQYMELFRRLR